MDDQQILEQVRSIIRSIVDDENAKIDFSTSANDIPGWDSMAHINIIVAIEEQFHMKFKPSFLEEAKDVRDLVSLIKAG